VFSPGHSPGSATLDLHIQSAVPVPGSLALMVSGLAGWAGLARRARRRADDRAG
jgi:hypothetical protein